MSLRTCMSVFVVALAGWSLLAAAEPNPVGFPAKVEAGGGIGVIRVWFADGTWHLRTSTDDSAGKKDKLLVFTGSVTCDDTVTATGLKLEKKGKTADTVTAHKGEKGFDFRFATYGATDEASFTVGKYGKPLSFKLFIDGAEVPPLRIFIGKDGEHPASHIFMLPAHPTK